MDVTVRVRNGTIMTPGGPVEADLLIAGEKILGLVARNEGTGAAMEIDASGKHVLPGLVDAHAHTRVPGYEYKEDFTTASQAAAVGGYTTLIDMPNVEPPTDSVELYEKVRRIAEKTCIIDWGHFISGCVPERVPAMAAAGVTGFKIFQVSAKYPHDPRLALIEPHQVYAAFEAIAKTGLGVVVHPFAQALFDMLSDRAFAAGKPRDLSTFLPLYTRDFLWSMPVAVLLELQRETGVALHLAHTHAGRSLQLLKRAKAEGQRVTAGIDPKWIHLASKDLEEQKGRAMPGGAVTENAERMRIIWESLNDGTLDTIDTDHAPHTLADIERFNQDPWTGPFGSPVYEYTLPLALNDISQGRFSLETGVRLLSENCARILGIYPRKGAILPASDADLVIVDLNKEVVPSDEATYTKVKWTPFRGQRLMGGPVLTMLRGKVIARDGKVIGEPGYGRYIEGVPMDPVPIEGFRSPGLAFQPRQRL